MARSGIAVAAPGEFDSLAASGAHRIGITFDDGFSSDLQCAELMHRHGIRGLFFIPTDTIGSPGRLGVEDLRTLVGIGMRIGSHSHEHIPITPECAEYQSKNVQGNPDPITRHANR